MTFARYHFDGRGVFGITAAKLVELVQKQFDNETRGATTSQSEHVVNECVGKPEIEIYYQLRQLFSKSIFMAALGYCKGGGENNPDPRLVAYAEKCVEQQFKQFPATGKRNLEEQLLALIRWANVQPANV
jgi:hypothetical protein